MSKTYSRSLIFSCLILVFGLMSVDFISPSLPYIQSDFVVSQQYIKNTLILYMLVLGVAQLLYGYLSDIYGRRIILLAFIINILGIGLSAVATNINMFYFARIVTAIGSAGCPVIARAIIADSSENELSMRKSFSIFSLSSQLSPSLAPIIGGTIQTLASWRISLVFLMLLNIVCFAILYKFMPETCSIKMSRSSRKNNFIKISEIISIYFNLFRHKYFFIMSLLSALIYIYTIGFYNILPFIFYHMNVSAITNGVISSMYALHVGLGCFILQKYLYKYASNSLFSRLAIIYIVYLFTSLIYFHFILPSTLAITLWGCILGFLCGLIAPLTMSMCMYGFNKNKGIASSVQSSIKMFFTGVGLMFFSQNNLVSINQIILIFFTLSIIIFILWHLIKDIK